MLIWRGIFIPKQRVKLLKQNKKNWEDVGCHSVDDYTKSSFQGHFLTQNGTFWSLGRNFWEKMAYNFLKKLVRIGYLVTLFSFFDIFFDRKGYCTDQDTQRGWPGQKIFWKIFESEKIFVWGPQSWRWGEKRCESTRFVENFSRPLQIIRTCQKRTNIQREQLSKVFPNLSKKGQKKFSPAAGFFGP